MTHILEEIQKLQLEIVSRHITQDSQKICLKLVIKTKKSLDIIDLKNKIQKI